MKQQFCVLAAAAAAALAASVAGAQSDIPVFAPPDPGISDSGPDAGAPFGSRGPESAPGLINPPVIGTQFPTFDALSGDLSGLSSRAGNGLRLPGLAPSSPSRFSFGGPSLGSGMGSSPGFGTSAALPSRLGTSVGSAVDAAGLAGSLSSSSGQSGALGSELGRGSRLDSTGVGSQRPPSAATSSGGSFSGFGSGSLGGGFVCGPDDFGCTN